MSDAISRLVGAEKAMVRKGPFVVNRTGGIWTAKRVAVGSTYDAADARAFALFANAIGPLCEYVNAVNDYIDARVHDDEARDAARARMDEAWNALESAVPATAHERALTDKANDKVANRIIEDAKGATNG